MLQVERVATTRELFRTAGSTHADVDETLRLLDDRTFWTPFVALCQVSARRPA